jgi:hypothetical protein
MTRSIIQPPRNQIFRTRLSTVSLIWSRDFPRRWQRRHINAQKFMAYEILRLSEPYIPLKTGALIRSGTVEEEGGNVTVQWTVPYARYQYFSPRRPGSPTGPLRGPYWFERMKATHMKRILERARGLAGNSLVLRRF